MLFETPRLRALARASLLFAIVAGARPALAATPAEGILTPTSGPLTFSSGPFTTSNPTPIPEADTGPRCNALAYCDSYKLTVQLPANFAANNPKAKLRVTTAWTPVGTDVDFWVFDGVQGDTDGTKAGIAPNAQSQANPETDIIPMPTDTSHVFTIKVVPFAATGATATTTIALEVPPPPPPDSDGDGVADPDDACADTPGGTTVDSAGCPISDLPELPLHFHGNTHDSTDGIPCTGHGNNDFVTCFGPFLKESAALDPDAPAAHWDYNPLGSTGAQGPYDANWTWQPTAAVTVKGYTKVQWWASCNGTCTALDLGDWNVSLWKNDVQVTEEFLLHATPSTPDVPALLGGAFRLAEPISLNGTTDVLTLKLEHAYSDAGEGSHIYYDSVSPCPAATGSAPCDSIITFNAKAPPPPPPPPVPTPATGLEPRYQIHVSPAELGNDAGEPSVGYNKFTKRSMFISYTHALRQTYQEEVNPPLLPASCPALWEDKSGTLTTVNSLDPILFTDEATGRIWNSQLSGDNSLMEYTDDDGENWVPAQQGPPNGGADHQAVASGPYPADAVPLLASWPATGDKRAVYYCSQSVAAAFCSRSDDGGQTFGPGFPFKNTDCAAGALHGHVKVAPDGTVYVPDSSQCVAPTGESAEHVVAFRSDDAGQTWSVKTVPFSTGGDGSDPSIGLATDGTMYMCYPNADSTVHVAVSEDRGDTWYDAGNIGAAAGLVQTRFPQMIAGDKDRAACAFLATTTQGNGSSLDFKGVWHGYVATTYDKGRSWHLVNVTPNDPVQGYGGIGPDGTNRNLLDFNDLQIDDQGRVYFAFADGCIGGCVRDPSANAFASKATIIRQTGGRTLFAKYDDVSAVTPNRRYNKETPVEPAAACARQDLSTRTPAAATVVWSAPDTGGAPITNYKVYRSLAQDGTFSFVGDAGAKNQYIDDTADPAVEHYFYRVEAVNAVNTAPVSNVIDLPITVAGDSCIVPGLVVAADPAGDTSPAGTDDLDIISAAVAEPRAFADSFVITLKVKNFTAGIPPETSFYVILFPLKGNLYIALDSTNGPATFVYGTFEELPQGLLAFTQDGTLNGSAFAADGTMTFVVPRSLFGDPAVDSVLSGFDIRTRIGASSSNSRDTAGPGDYIVHGIANCPDPNALPVLASLAASVDHGTAPLPVTFTLSGTPPEGQTLQSYSLTFGDNSAPQTGTLAGGSAEVAHTYAAAGTYRASLTVTDSAGTSSTNLAEQTITVLEPGIDPGTGGGTGDTDRSGIGNNSVGGALPALSVLLLGGLGLLRRRVRARPISR